MAIKRFPSVTTDEEAKKITGTLYADTKAEVTDDLTFEDGYSMDAGSVVFTGDFNFGIMTSSGSWSWKS